LTRQIPFDLVISLVRLSLDRHGISQEPRQAHPHWSWIAIRHKCTPVELRQTLLKQKDTFIGQIVGKVLGYALKRSLQDWDSAAQRRD
jgi:hypothetical protein